MINGISINQNISPNDVTITGTGLCKVKASSCLTLPAVTINGINLTLSASTPTSLQGTLPPLSPGSYRAQVTVKGAGSTAFYVTAGASLPTCISPDMAVLYQGTFVCKSTIPHYVDNGDGTVTDNVTGLMWEKKSPAGTGDLHDVNTAYSWSTANSGQNPDGTLFTVFLAGLNGGDYYSPIPSGFVGTPVVGLDVSPGLSACFANHCDWRIPTMAELSQIIEPTAAGCLSGSLCIDPNFGPTKAADYWSSSSVAGYPASAWTVYFSDGHVDSNSKSYDSYTRAVRGGP